MKKLLFIADPPAGGGGATETPAQTIARLTAELKIATDKIVSYEKADAQRTADEKVIAQKMSLGLSRDQAIAVIKRQKDHDTAKAAALKPAVKK